jgi:hypothetical protein
VFYCYYGRTEAELVSKIVDNVKKQLNNSLLNIIENPVGLKICVQQVNQFIGNQSSKVCFIGIWGMGGSGKTLIAKAIYNKLHCEFDNHSFIKNVRDVCNIGDGSDKGIEELQECILKELQKTDEKIFGNALKTIKQICKSKRVLIVLDDVSTVKQVEHLCGARNYFGPGSVLIVTSRDAHIFNSLKFDHVYNIKEMDKNNSLELFSWHAFKQASPLEDFKELSESIADYCGGLPLALEVIGSSLNGREKKFWEKIPSYLKRVPNKEVQKRLKISFDGLDEKFERNIFLDICCFFIGKDRAYVTDILNGCGLYADNGIAVLIERSLLRVKNNNKLEMHDLLRDMGRKFVEESAKKLGKRSRLWFQEDVHDVLKENSVRTFSTYNLKLLIIFHHLTKNFYLFVIISPLLILAANCWMHGLSCLHCHVQLFIGMIYFSVLYHFLTSRQLMFLPISIFSSHAGNYLCGRIGFEVAKQQKGLRD